MSDYSANSSESDIEKNPNPARRKTTIESRKDLPVALKRENAIYSDRSTQLTINTLAVAGGRDYVNKRLSRYAGESKIEWEGGNRSDGSGVTGRKQQSHSFPYAGRIVDKIDQYVFSTSPTRDGLAEEIAADMSADGKSIDQLMKAADGYLTSCGWCWIGVDSPNLNGKQISVTEKNAQKIRPYWNVYSPLAVKDWKYDAIGELEWLITETVSTESTTVDAEPQTFIIRRIWERGIVRTVKLTKDKAGKLGKYSDETVSISYTGVPFVMVGHAQAGGHTFDDIESINRTIMDLESVNRANFFKRAYPQPVLPASVIQNTADAYGTDSTGAADLIFGLGSPILVSPEDKDPMYLMPAASDMGAIRVEIQQLKMNMFDSVGLMLKNESKQVASAESKAWDFLDVAMVMKARAQTLQEAEAEAAKITSQFDSSIPEWTPVYNTDFDIGDFQQEINALVMAGNVPMPVEMSQMVLTKLADRLDRLGAAVTPEDREIIMESIRNFDPTALTIESMENLQATPEP